MRFSYLTFTFLALVFCGAPAWSHGNKTHADVSKSIRFEQQAWGIAGEVAKVRHTMRVNLLDTMRFTPAKLNFKVVRRCA